MDNENVKEEFKKVFRGYDPVEVDDHIQLLKNDIESLKSESAELYRKLNEVTGELERYKRTEAVGTDIIKGAKTDADSIVNDAKGRAARIIIRTSRQCNRIVADMVSQVEEQKNIYETTKREVVRFRQQLLEMYKDHIKRVNIFAEAAGAFDSNALSESELENYMNYLGDEPVDDEADEIGGDFENADVEGEVMRIKKEAAQNAEKFVKDNLIHGAYGHQAKKSADSAQKPAEQHAAAAPKEEKRAPEVNRLSAVQADDDLFNDYSGSPDDIAEDDADKKDSAPAGVPAEEPKAAESSADGGAKYNAPHIPDDADEMTYTPDDEDEDEFAGDDEDADEFRGGETEGTVDEFEGPVSLNDVFGTLDSYRDADFESVYGEEEKTLADLAAEEAEAARAEEILERRRRADDDSNEFYDEDDDEYDPDLFSGEPTSEVVSAAETRGSSFSKKKKRKKKKSMTITDEFRAVRRDDDN